MIGLLEFYLTGSILAAALWTVVGVIMHYIGKPFENFEFYPMFAAMILFSWIGLASMVLVLAVLGVFEILKITIAGIIYLLIQLGIIIYDNFKRIQNEKSIHNKGKK